MIPGDIRSVKGKAGEILRIAGASNFLEPRFRLEHYGIRQPDIAHRMYALFQEAGLSDVQVEPLTQVTADYESMRPVAHFVEGMFLARNHNVVTTEEADSWIAFLEEAARTGCLFHAITSTP